MNYHTWGNVIKIYFDKNIFGAIDRDQMVASRSFDRPSAIKKLTAYVRKPGGSWCSNRVAGDKTSVRPSLFIDNVHVCRETVQIMYRWSRLDATQNIYNENYKKKNHNKNKQTNSFMVITHHL